MTRFEAWSHRLVVNACYAQIRAARRARELPSTIVDVWPVHGTPFELVADQETIERALARLPVTQRAVVTLHHRFGLTLERVAEVLSVPVGTVYSRLHRAMDGMRAAIEADEREATGIPGLPVAGDTPTRPRARPWTAGSVRPRLRR